MKIIKFSLYLTPNSWGWKKNMYHTTPTYLYYRLETSVCYIHNKYNFPPPLTKISASVSTGHIEVSRVDLPVLSPFTTAVNVNEVHTHTQKLEQFKHSNSNTNILPNALQT
jgi:hypothetical protein